MNSSGGEGAEVVYSLRNSDTLAKKITEEINKEGQIIRKYYQRRLPENPMQDYYFIQRLTGNLESLLIEYGFIDNPKDLKKLQNNLTNYVEGVVRALADYAGYEYTPPKDTTTQQPSGTYIVQKGDSLWNIANKYNTTVSELKRLNNLTSDILQVGQILKIPNIQDIDSTTTIYIVQKNDSLWSIAQKFSTTVEDLKKLNNLTSDILQVGQELLIKEKEETTLPNQPETTITYTVQKGDSLWSIANKYNTTIGELRRLNNLTNDVLSIGQVLKVPTTTTDSPDNIYIVQKGDSLFLIAQKYGISVEELIKENNLKSTTIKVGDKLKIPTNTTMPIPTTYTVQRGDSLWSIANKYNTTVEKIKTLNNLTSNILSIGQILKIS